MRKSLTLLGLIVILVSLLLGACSSDGGSSCPDKAGTGCVWAGITGELGFDKDGNDKRESRLYWPLDMEFAPDGTPYILDWNNHRIRRVRPDGTLETVVGRLFVGDGPDDMSDLAPPGAIGTSVNLNHPTDIQFGADGTLIFAAWHNHKIRTVNVTSDYVLVMCGRGAGFTGDGGPAAMALFNQPKAIELDKDGSLYVLDQRNFRIRKIGPGANPTISTVVGTGTAGFGGDGGPPNQALLKFEAGGNPEPSGALALGPDNKLYISDGLNHRIRRVDFTENTIVTVAGTGEPGYSGDGGPAAQAQINNARDLEFGPDGRLYVADTDNNRIRAIDLSTGTIETVAGTGVAGVKGEGLPARQIELNRPFGIAFDKDGALYISDTFNSRVLRVP